MALTTIAVLGDGGPAAFIEQLPGNFGVGPIFAPRGGKLNLLNKIRHDQQQQQRTGVPKLPSRGEPHRYGVRCADRVQRAGSAGEDIGDC